MFLECEYGLTEIFLIILYTHGNGEAKYCDNISQG